MTTGPLDAPSETNMDDGSSTQSFPNHHHRHCPSFQLTLPQSPDLGYPSPQPGLHPLGEYGSGGGRFTASFPTSSASPGGRRPSTGEDRGTRNGLGGGANMGGHRDGGSGVGGHFGDTWCGSIKEEDVWEHQASCERAGDNVCYNNTNDVSCPNEEGVSHQLKANIDNYPHVSDRGVTGSFWDSTGGYCRTDARVSDIYLGGEEDYGSSCGSGEDQLQSAAAGGPWVRVGPSMQTAWRATADGHAHESACPGAAVDVSRGTSAQRLDSFSEAFLSRRKRALPLVPRGGSSGRMWGFGAGRGENPGRDSHAPPPSPPPTHHPPLVSFPSPPASSHFMPSVLSPPPTPRPPPILSPSKMDSPGAFAGTGHSASQGGDSLDVLQFFASHLQALPSIHSSGMMWKFPLLAHGSPQPSGDPEGIEGDLRSCHGGDFGNIAAPENLLKSPETSFLSSVHPASTLCPSTTPSLRASRPPHHYEAAPYVMGLRIKDGPGSLNQPQLQSERQPSQIYSGAPFPSVLHCCRGQERGRYTPRPLLNPARRGMGLYSSLSSLHHRVEETCGEEQEGCVFPYVNVGRDFQAELPRCFAGGDESGLWSSEEGFPQEQLLWEPLDELVENTNSQDEVEKLLTMCRSSCLPGGGSNIELALHCLHHCQGNILATLDMLLFTQPLPTGDYHYSGSDFWTESEKVLFNAALGTYGKEFSLIQKMVRTKTTGQCVEFFYLSKKLQDKQKKQREKNREGEVELQRSMTPAGRTVSRQFGLEVAVPVPSLASFFPCKLCGKMFYKIKSRNAHMKIHRQTQEDWTDRHHRLLAQRLGGNLLPPRAPAGTLSSSGLPGAAVINSIAVLNSVNNINTFPSSNSSVLGRSSVVTYGDIAMSHSHLITTIDGDESSRGEATTVMPFNQLWGSFV